MKRVAALAVSVLMTPFAAFAASPTIIGTPQTGYTNGTSHTQSITVDSTGQNRCLIVITFQGGLGSEPTSVTYNSSEMTKIVDLVGAQQIPGQMFYMADPTTGTHDIVATYAGSADSTSVIGFVLQDCAQSSPLDVSGQANSGGATSLSKEVTTTVNDDILIIWAAWNTSASSINPDAGQTDIVADQTPPSVDYAASWEEAATAGAFTEGYSWTGSTNLDLYVAAIKYQAPTAAASTPTNSLFTNVIFFMFTLPFALKRYDEE